MFLFLLIKRSSLASNRFHSIDSLVLGHPIGSVSAPPPPPPIPLCLYAPLPTPPLPIRTPPLPSAYIPSPTPKFPSAYVPPFPLPLRLFAPPLPSAYSPPPLIPLYLYAPPPKELGQRPRTFWKLLKHSHFSNKFRSPHYKTTPRMKKYGESSGPLVVRVGVVK